MHDESAPARGDAAAAGGEEMPSRRAFVLRAGRLGLALSAFGPGLGAFFSATSARAASLGDLAGGAPPADPGALWSALRWRLIGPFRGGRVAAASGVPGRPNEFYFGAVNGGVWKS